jgi:hypothetical protein
MQIGDYGTCMSSLSEQYRLAAPFPHIKIDGHFPDERLRGIVGEIQAAQIDPEAPGYGWLDKRRASELDRFPPKTRELVEELNSPPFIAWLEQLTGIEGLIPDPSLEGGGIHQINTGGYLKIHTDFNWHKRLELHRRINLLLYLNEGWDEQWGGALELWHERELASPRGRPAASYAPLFNRMVIFSTTDFSYHGHPEPLKCPPHVRRNSIALYYYSKTRPQNEIRFGHSDMTNYRARQTDRLGFKHKIHQALIRSPLLRKVVRRDPG